MTRRSVDALGEFLTIKDNFTERDEEVPDKEYTDFLTRWQMKEGVPFRQELEDQINFLYLAEGREPPQYLNNPVQDN